MQVLWVCESDKQIFGQRNAGHPPTKPWFFRIRFRNINFHHICKANYYNSQGLGRDSILFTCPKTLTGTPFTCCVSASASIQMAKIREVNLDIKLMTSWHAKKSSTPIFNPKTVVKRRWRPQFPWNSFFYKKTCTMPETNSSKQQLKIDGCVLPDLPVSWEKDTEPPQMWYVFSLRGNLKNAEKTQRKFLISRWDPSS